MIAIYIEKYKAFCVSHAYKIIAKLASIEGFLVSCVLYLWLATWVTKALEHVGRAQHFHGQWTVSLNEWGVAATIVILIRVFMTCERTDGCNFALNEEWCKILTSNWTMCRLRVVYFLASSIILTAFIFFFAVCSFDLGAKALACLLSDVGQYELAERLYRVAPDLDHNKRSGRYNSMAAWHSSDVFEDATTVQRKNSAVATVYGADSLEMAGRYFYLGLVYQQQGTRTGELQGINWHYKALSIYKHHHSITKCVDVLTQIAILQDGFNKPEFERLIAQAASLTPQLDEEPYVCTPTILPYFAKRNGNDWQAKLLEQALEKHKRLPQEIPFWVEPTIVLLALFCSRFGCSLAKARCLRTLAASAHQSYIRTATPDAQFKLLTKLVTLNLISRNLQVADKQSIKMLMLAEGNQPEYSTIGENLISLQKPLKIELFRAFFAVAILWLF